jgi:hypothetical protein
MEEGTTDTAKCAGVVSVLVSWPFFTAYPRYVG